MITVVCRPLKLVCGRNVEKFGVASKKALDCCKQSLIRYSLCSSEDQNISVCVDSKGSSGGFSGGQESVGNRASGHSCYILGRIWLFSALETLVC